MKVRVLHTIDHLGYGGAPFVVKGLVERMPSDRIEQTVCALRANPRPIPIDAAVINLNCRKFSPAAVRAIARICTSRQIDIIHAHLQKAAISSLLARSLCASKVIVHEHGPIFRGGTGWIYRRLLRWLISRADAIVANSEAAKAALGRALADTRTPIVVVGNFIDLQRFDPDRYDRTAVRESLGFGRDEFVVGFVGRLDPAKGADLLVEAAAALRSTGSAYRFLVVGEGPHKGRLEQQVRRLGLDETVVLAGLHENTAAVMRACDLGVVPSRREAFGIAALELMRMKVPVIVSAAGGLPELVRHGETGIVLPRPEPQAIADAIRTLAQDAALRERLARSAFQHASTFDGRRQVQQMVQMYEQLVQRDRP